MRNKARNCGQVIKSGRICLVLGTVVIAILGVFFRIVQLQGRESENWNLLARKQYSTALEIQGARGTIFDSTGRTLAVSVEGRAVGIRPKVVNKKSLSAVASALNLSNAELERKISESNRFTWIARGVSNAAVENIRNVDLKGFEIFPEFYRDYPQGNIARQIIGQVSSAGLGIAGIEGSFNRQLSAQKGKISLNRDAKGRLIESQLMPDFFNLSLDSLVETAMATENIEELPPIRDEGGDIHLSIDTAVQSVLEEELENGRIESSALKVVGIIMRAETGEILAMATARKDSKHSTGKFLSVEELRNPIVQDIYEPGSTFKPLVAALALDGKKVTLSEQINCENGNYPVGKYTIHDAHPVGVVPFSDVLIRSSNVGIAKIGARLGEAKLRAGIESLGFGQKSGVELPGEETGLLQTGKWGAIEVATNSFGQGISVTPMQLVRAYAALANGGRLVVPTVLQVKDREVAMEGADRVFSKATAIAITETLVGVTEDEEGTGNKAAIEGLKVSGKTGTAQKPRKGHRGYDSERIFASFIGYVDAGVFGRSEHLVMFVGVDEPGVKPRWGGVVAAPIFKKTVERVLAHRAVATL